MFLCVRYKEVTLPLGKQSSPGSVLGKQSTGGWKATWLLAGLGAAHSLLDQTPTGAPSWC